MLRRTTGGGPTRIFFAADLHGSEPTYRKFLTAATFYDVDALVFGGDLMGKALVPIVRTNGSYRARYLGEDVEFDGGEALDAFRRAVETTGFYWKVMEPEEYQAAAAGPALVQRLFEELASERLSAWIALAEERLAGTRVRLYLSGGNDDEPGVLSVLDDLSGEHVVSTEGAVVDLDGEHSMISVGVSSRTPWDSPREASEEEIGALIDASAERVPDVGRCLFNLHCPPKDTPLDTCVKVERMDGLEPGALPRPVREGGRFVTIGGGSAA